MARTKEFEPDDAVERAMQQFWSAGYAATTPQQLVDALHIGRSSLYNAFGSKQGLFEQALARYLDREAQRVVDALDQPGPPIERLGAAVRLVIHGADADPQRRGCLVTNTATESGARDGAVAALVGQQLGQRGPTPKTLGTLKSIADCISITAAVSNTLHADGAEQVRLGAATHSAVCVFEPSDPPSKYIVVAAVCSSLSIASCSWIGKHSFSFPLLLSIIRVPSSQRTPRLVVFAALSMLKIT